MGDIVEAADDLDDVLSRALEAIIKTLGLSAGGLWWHDGMELATQPLWFDTTGALTSVQRAREGLAYPADVMIHTRETATRHGIDVLPTIVTAALHEAGISASFMVPIVADGVTIGGYEMIPAAAGEPSPRRLLAAAQAAAEVGRWIERDRPARWLRDLADRTRDPEGEAVTRIPTERVRRRSAVKARIVAADERDELSVAYEPIVHLASGTTTAVEALARWDDAVLGRVAPNEFIPIAEESSAIARIGAFVRRRALADRTGLQARHAAADGFAVWVNVSARELDRGFADAVHAELEQAGVPAQCLALEVTEREALSAQSPGCAQLHELAASGVGIAIDDFGTGFTSLTQLRNLPLTHIKIDRSFVTDLAGEHGHRVRPIVGGIVSLGHSLGLQIVTEGIETLEQLEIARALGADLAQGHLLSR